MSATKEPSRTKEVRGIILVFLSFFVVVFGVPLFLYTTQIHRANLPVEDVQRRAALFESNLTYDIPIYFEESSPVVRREAQALMDSAIHRKFGKNIFFVPRLLPLDSSTCTNESYILSYKQSNSDGSTYSLSDTSKEINLYASDRSNLADQSSFIRDVITDAVFRDELSRESNIIDDKDSSDVVFPYSTSYNLVFNFFVEDGTPVDWEIEQALHYIQPVLDAFKHYTTFKVSSQIHYYSKLQNSPVTRSDGSAKLITKDHLPTFINYGEWNLNIHDISPSINFLVYFSAENYKNIPLLVEGSKTNSFLIPQWGGVHVFNTKEPISPENPFTLTSDHLKPIFEIFASQLFELLGVPKNPKNPLFRIDSFHRIATLKNLKRAVSNLSALCKIANSLNGISIPESTRISVTESLSYFDSALQALKNADFKSAVAYSAKSVDRSDKAFFEKEMVQQAYFPSEHKLAVFSPLLGPICSIVLLGVLKLVKDRKEQKKQATNTSEEKKDS